MVGSKSNVTVGQIYKTTSGMVCEVIEYNNYKDVLVRFEDGYVRKTTTTHLKRGTVKNPFHRNSYGVGFLGEGCYRASVGEVSTPEYGYWNSMMFRCYSDKMVKYPTYDNCCVDERWHNFQVFAEWCQTARGFNTPRWALDKDLLVKGNKIYSPETCVFLPSKINGLIKNPSIKKRDLPIGVSYNGISYVAQISHDGLERNAGSYDTPEAAFLAYKEKKEGVFRHVAQEWKNKIDVRAYEALMSRTVEISD